MFEKLDLLCLVKFMKKLHTNQVSTYASAFVGLLVRFVNGSFLIKAEQSLVSAGFCNVTYLSR